ncbi:class I adenylate-forming enzyme family protein [Desertimonas flava]|uniref:class I adenylate-forming enzyme family protein n=1 Tax=Desertimonas flava TaxID=2064846 RepID=UPI000E34A922|nr:class I adenylate-forming enzyme family protein [Desertimonas flava]
MERPHEPAAAAGSSPFDGEYGALHAELTATGGPFEMMTVAVGGRDVRTWKHAPTNLRDLLEASRRHGEREYLVDSQRRISFADHLDLVAAFALEMRDTFGVGDGDRVAVAMRNRSEWVVAFWAIAALGAVAVPLNSWWSGPELAFGVHDSGAALVVCDTERAARLRAAACDVQLVVVDDSAGEVPDGTRRFRDWPVRPGVELPPATVHPDSDATILYTSGTTGRPKGAIATHRNICSSVTSLAFTSARDSRRAGRQVAGAIGPARLLVGVPLFHVTGLYGLIVGSLAAGSALVLMPKWDAGAALELIERERITAFSGVPAMTRQLVDHPDVATRELSSLVSLTYGGAAAAPELARRVRRALPQRTLRNGWGLTETCTVVTMISGADYANRPDSVGVPIPVCDVATVDDEGHQLPPGSTGELVVRGPNVVRGYWNLPEATASAFADGWFRTGDIGRVDAGGFVTILDRAKDLIIRGGENVSSAEVEAAMFEHPAVDEVAAIPVPHDVLGEEVGVVVRLRDGADVDVDGLRAHAASQLAAFKVPVHVWIVDEPLPRSPQGKVLKRELRAILGGSAR